MQSWHSWLAGACDARRVPLHAARRYDSIQQARVQPKQQEKLQRQSKYISQLKDQAEARKREEVRRSAGAACRTCRRAPQPAQVGVPCVCPPAQDIRFERRQLKERIAEDHLYEGKDKFITSAYRKKLEEDKKWQEQQKLK